MILNNWKTETGRWMVPWARRPRPLDESCLPEVERKSSKHQPAVLLEAPLLEAPLLEVVLLEVVLWAVVSWMKAALLSVVLLREAPRFAGGV